MVGNETLILEHYQKTQKNNKTAKKQKTHEKTHEKDKKKVRERVRAYGKDHVLAALVAHEEPVEAVQLVGVQGPPCQEGGRRLEHARVACYNRSHVLDLGND